jgi:uroporphyrinogen-III synthase
MEKALALGELSCRSLTLYTMADCERFRPDVERSLARGEIDGVVLMSPRTAEVFVAACKAAALMERARRFIYFCLSARVAEKLKCLAPMTVRVSDRADRRALVRLIGSAGTDARVGALNPLGETGCQPRCPKINDQGRR